MVWRNGHLGVCGGWRGLVMAENEWVDCGECVVDEGLRIVTLECEAARLTFRTTLPWLSGTLVGQWQCSRIPFIP